MQLIGHETIIQFFQMSRKSGAFAHASLFTGPFSVGKTTLILFLAKMLLCEKGSGEDQCRSCIAFDHRQHPDVFLYDPDTEEQQEIIPIEVVRNAEHRASLTPLFGKIKIVALTHADRLNREAANALLKLVEEPPQDTVLFLSSEFPERLPLTLRSRMQRFYCTTVSTDRIVTLLTAHGVTKEDAATLALLSEGCPGRALRAASDPKEAAYLQETFVSWIELLQRPLSIFSWVQVDRGINEMQSFFRMGQIILHDLLRAQWGKSGRFPMAKNIPDYTLPKLVQMSTAVTHAMTLLRTNASPKLICEDLFLSFV